MNTTENNKIIAEFMGFKEQKDPTERFFGQWLINKPSEIAWSNREKILFFDCDWNWLMEVIFKITKLGVSYDDKGNELFLKIGENLLMLKIQPTYDAVFDLIKWYNEQNS